MLRPVSCYLLLLPGGSVQTSRCRCCCLSLSPVYLQAEKRPLAAQRKQMSPTVSSKTPRVCVRLRPLANGSLTRHHIVTLLPLSIHTHLPSVPMLSLSPSSRCLYSLSLSISVPFANLCQSTSVSVAACPAAPAAGVLKPFCGVQTSPLNPEL